MKLRELAHARTGDKGTILNVSVIAFDVRDYARLEDAVTSARVAEHLAGIIRGEVVRYTLPQIGALNFVMQRPPGDSVTRTLALDAHAKSLSSAILNLDIEDTSGVKGQS